MRHELNTNKANIYHWYSTRNLNQHSRRRLEICSILECPVCNVSCLKCIWYNGSSIFAHAQSCKGLKRNALSGPVDDDDLKSFGFTVPEGITSAASKTRAGLNRGVPMGRSTQIMGGSFRRGLNSEAVTSSTRSAVPSLPLYRNEEKRAR